MRPTTSLCSRVLAVLALALAAACADSSIQPTAPDGRRLHADLIEEAAGSTDSTAASADSTVASADTASADTASADTASAPADSATVVTSSDTASAATTPTSTASTDTATSSTTSTETAPSTDTTTTAVGIATLDEESDGLMERPTFLTPQPLVCPSDEAVSDQAVIGPDGGMINVRGTSITIPAGAVSEETLFEVILPASPYMETEIHAVGTEHFFFAQPATITINYSRCAADAVPETARPQGAYIDSNSKKILELMGGEVDRAARKVTFSTGHLSGYVVAF